MKKNDENKAMEEEIEKIGREPWELWDYSEGEFGLSEDDKGKIDSHELVMEIMQAKAREGSEPYYLGFAFYVAPLNTDIVLDFTTVMGKCSGIYWSYVFQMPKWAFNLRKVSESMEVSPIHADTYNLFMGQRQKLESQIKQGLTSAMQSVTDYELLAHDSRRYREILDYFKQGRKDEHVLRSLFVDRVDAHTGEGYSMITMAKRWPTIITDFIRLGQEKFQKTEWTTDKVVHDLDVTQAEATVLVTKDRLFKEWRKLFMPSVAERYARIQAIVEARKKSIDDYKEWLKPYIARHKMMKEQTEKPSVNLNSPYMAPAFGTGSAFTSVRLWVWKAFPVGEKRKPYAKVENRIDGIPWIVDPLDDTVREWARKIEYKYRLPPGYYTKNNDRMIRKILKASVNVDLPLQAENPVTAMVPSEFYYVLFDIQLNRSVLKTPPPAGSELENFMIKPMRTWIASQNVMLIHLIELDAREKAFDRDVDAMIGAKSREREYMEESRMLLGKEAKAAKKMGSASRFVDGVRRNSRRVRRQLNRASGLFFRPGPYESVFYERVVKMYLVEVGAFYKQQVDFWKQKMGVG
jgi:hypothetical protein